MIVDDREVKRVINKGRKFFPDLVKARLEVGDVVEGSVVFERKEIEDFCSSVISGRVFSQAQNMRLNYENCYIIIIGDFEKVRNNRYINFTIDQFIGAMASLTTKYGCSCLRVDNQTQYWKLIKAILSKTGEKPTQREKRVKKVKGNSAVACLCGVPNLGEKKARALLRRFKTIENVCKASEEDLCTVNGIGIKRARNIRKVLCGE
jgi:Fanconi anemia group M protein